MKFNMVIKTPTNDFVSMLLVCLNCPKSIYGRDFGVYLICLPLCQLDAILGMNWLSFNHVHIDCFNKTIMFSKLERSKDSRFISANQVEMS